MTLDNIEQINSLLDAPSATEREKLLTALTRRAISLIEELSADGGPVEAATRALVKCQDQRDRVKLRLDTLKVDLEESQTARNRLAQQITRMQARFTEDMEAHLRRVNEETIPKAQRKAWHEGTEAKPDQQGNLTCPY